MTARSTGLLETLYGGSSVLWSGTTAGAVTHQTCMSEHVLHVENGTINVSSAARLHQGWHGRQE
jgi:hypothetical protein